MTFPNRTTRSQLGPRFRDVYPVENPETDIGAQQFNAAFDQVAGMNVIVARVSLVAKHNGGGVFDVYHQAEAWNSDQSLAHPVLAIDPIASGGPGRYIYTFAATYPDGDGAMVATSLRAPKVWTFGAPASDATPYADRTSARAWIKPSDPLVVKIAVFDAAGAPVDAPFWLEIL